MVSVKTPVKGFGEIEWVPWKQTENPKDLYHYARDWEYSCWRFQEFVKPGMTVVDIGAHTGDYTMPFGLLAGPKGLVIAFEPNPVTYKVLRSNAMANASLCTFECFNIAIMPKDGDYTFHYGDNSFCNGGYAEGLETPVGTGKICHNVPLKVVGRRAQPFLDGHKVDFLKIDTEGYDDRVLECMSDIISRDKPVIMAEVFTDLTMNERERFRTLVERIGYGVRYNGAVEQPHIKHFLSTVAFDVNLYPL